MENMSPIFMDIYSMNILCIDITSNMWTFIYNQTTFSGLNKAI